MVSLSQDARRGGLAAGAAGTALAGGLLALAVAALYAPLWAVCWKEWWGEESYYSHGILIPPLAALMIWHRRAALAQAGRLPAVTGALPVLLGLALQLFSRWSHSTTISWLSFLLLTLGGVAFTMGWRVAAHLLPPVLFLTFMVPMTAMLIQPIVFGAQKASVQLADVYLHLMGFETHRLGVIIRMENFTLQVGVPCSGFKTMIALASFAACFIYLLNGSFFKKAILFGAALVLSLLVNGLRIALVGVTGELVSHEAGSWVHDNGGLPVTVLALGGLFLLARMMKCSLTPLRLTILTLLVGVAAVAATRLPTVQSEAQAVGVAPTSLPLTLGEWQGVDQPVPPDVQQALPSARLLSRRYQCSAGAADVTIIAGSDATALHDPHDCLTGEGWQFVTEGTRAVDLAQGARDPVTRHASRVTRPTTAVATRDPRPATRDPLGSIQVRDVVMVKGAVRARMWYRYTIGPEIYDRTLTARMALYRTRMRGGQRRRAEFVRLIVGGETESARTTTLLTSLTREIAGRGTEGSRVEGQGSDTSRPPIDP